MLRTIADNNYKKYNADLGIWLLRIIHLIATFLAKFIRMSVKIFNWECRHSFLKKSILKDLLFTVDCA